MKKEGRAEESCFKILDGRPVKAGRSGGIRGCYVVMIVMRKLCTPIVVGRQEVL